MIGERRRIRGITAMTLLISLGMLPLSAKPGSGNGSSGKGSDASSGSSHGNLSRGFRGAVAKGKAKSAGTQLAQNAGLAAKLQGLLPPGTDLQTAATGFRNLGQFVAAVHVSYNLGISFDRLKAEMVVARRSLGEAIRTLKPEVDSEDAIAEAEHEAGLDSQETGG